MSQVGQKQDEAAMLYRGFAASIAVLILLGADVVFADPVPGISATATSELVSGTLDRAAVHTVDGSGLTGVIHATSGEGRFWESVGIGAGFGADRAPAITFDLHDIFFLESMRIWNFAEANSAVRRAQILASLDLVDFNSLGVQTFATAVNPAQDVNLNGVLARYVRLEVLENGGGTVFPFLLGNPGTSGFAGLGEVQFLGTAVPEPSSLILIGLGIAALLMRSRWSCGQRVT
jgi:PEP-CTERM motif